MGLVEARKQEIYDANGAVFGISVDSPFSQAKWAEQEGYHFPLLSDLGKETARAYGSLYEEFIGLKGVAKRSAFLIDKTGKIVKKEVLEDAKQIPDLGGFIDALKKLG
jgi:peroxiredoxin